MDRGVLQIWELADHFGFIEDSMRKAMGFMSPLK
jgi:hypothetical protein